MNDSNYLHSTATLCDVQQIGFMFDEDPKQSTVFHVYKNYTSSDYQPFDINQVLDYRLKMSDRIGDPQQAMSDEWYRREVAGCDLLLTLLVTEKAYD